MKELKKYFTYEVLEIVLRIWAGFYVFIYGIGKIVQFNGAKSLDITIKEASNSQIMWAFFGTTLSYPIMIGSLQILGAILLVFNKSKLIGAILLTPLFLNIIVLDLLYEIHRGALLNAILFQIVFLIIIIKERERIKLAFNTLWVHSNKHLTQNNQIAKWLLGFKLAVILIIFHLLIV